MCTHDFDELATLMSEPPNPTPVGDGLTYRQRNRLNRVLFNLGYMGDGFADDPVARAAAISYLYRDTDMED